MMVETASMREREEMSGFLSEDSRKGSGSTTDKYSCCKSEVWSVRRKCCLGCFIAVLLLCIAAICVILSIFLKPTLSVNNELWEQKLSSENSPEILDIDGVYDLVSFSDTYEEYLTAMGAPWYARPLILAASESIEINTDEEGARMVISTSVKTREEEFKWNTLFNSSYPFGVMWMNCTLQDQANIFCLMEDREREMKMSSKLTFSNSGLVNERVHITQNITTKKYYEKQDAISMNGGTIPNVTEVE